MSNTEKTGGRDVNYWRRRMGLPVEEGNVGAGTSAPAPEPASAPEPVEDGNVGVGTSEGNGGAGDDDGNVGVGTTS